MAKRKNPDDPKHPDGPDYPDEPKKDYPHGEPPKHKPEGREHQVHKEILARRMRGGPAPTPEAYARALEQWQNLPGSVVRPPADVTPPDLTEQAKSAGEKPPTPEEPEE